MNKYLEKIASLEKLKSLAGKLKPKKPVTRDMPSEEKEDLGKHIGEMLRSGENVRTVKIDWGNK